MDDTFSKLKPYSLGIVAKNKLLDTHKIEVTPIEDLVMIDGEITDTGVDVNSKGSDRFGSTYETNVAASNTVEATWLPFGSPNRFTAPDVRRGEYVMIYQYGDVDKYYWTTMKDDLTLRKLETVIYAYSGTRDEFKGVSADTHYFLEISTHKKLVHFHTSKADGEPYVYDVQICTKAGYIIIQDDIGNIFTIDSKEHRIELMNTDGTHQDMDKRNYTVTVPDNTTINTGKNTTITTGADTKIETSGNTTVTTGGNTKINTSGNTEITSGGDTKVQTSGSTTIQSSGTTAIASGGSLSLQTGGGLSLSASGGGGAKLKADNIEIEGTMKVTKLITGAEIDCPSISGVASGLK